ncbi:MAG: transmembrane 220 family protein [Ferruginibacter sp.]
MKVFNIIFCFIFIVFAALQYNDPDPYLWVPIYMYTSVLCWLAARKRYFTKAYLLGIAVYAGYAVYKVFDPNGLLDWLHLHHAENLAGTMKAEEPWIEESREFFGLVILIVVLSLNYFAAIKMRKNKVT